MNNQNRDSQSLFDYFKPYFVHSSSILSHYQRALSFPSVLELYYNSFEMDQNVIIVAENHQASENLYRELKLFSQKENPIHFYPHLEFTYYKRETPVLNHVYFRSKVIGYLVHNKKQFIITNIKALTSYVNLNLLNKVDFYFKRGENISLSELKKTLIKYDYVDVSKVLNVGEYSIRGSIIDIFCPYYDLPVRINLFDEEVEDISFFDVDEQIGQESIDTYILTPLNYENIDEDLYRVKLETMSNEMQSYFNEEIDRVGHLYDFQNYQQFFNEKLGTLDELTNKENVLYFLYPQSIQMAYKNFMNEINFYKEKSDLLTENTWIHYHSDYDFFKHSNNIKYFMIEQFDSKEVLVKTLNYNFFQYLDSNMEKKLEMINAKIEEGYKLVISAEHSEQIKRLKRLVSSEMLSNLKSKKESLILIQSPVERGFENKESKIIWITENELFGRKKRKKIEIDDSFNEISHFLDLKLNDYVVHINYGIGLYRGLERIKTGNKSKDFLKIEYDKKSFVYVPIEQINLVQQYIGKKENLKIDDLSSKAWDRVKKRVKKEVESIAKDLIDLYSKRKNLSKVPFSTYNPFQIQFESDFPYEETKDQLKAFDKIQTHMEQSIPMDHLLCGDVGFGKTEVAMRAAFKAVMDGRQVGVMAPTTILSEQHYQVFEKRFKNYSIRVEVINRFRSSKEIKRILTELEEGKIEILIGTHRIISDDVVFNNLGLLIIDEEQKFGVKQKEKIRSSFYQVDTLALSATPIPRTLHMSLLEIRTLSLLKTPPTNRLPVKTFVMEFDENTLKKAIKDEIHRNGQVYFLHNRITDIYDISSYLKNLLGDDVAIAVAHGKMESELEDIMLDFIDGRYDVLLSTTIIDSGIDIPNTNTIIINNAHHFGLSQLYQLRGRVGRSVKQGYAYLFYQKDKALSEEASKRLHSILDYTNLGSGFEIAMKDIEIRGVGNILGEKQSGNVSLVGYEMYCRLLEEAIDNIQNVDKKRIHNDVYVDMKYDGYINDRYISDIKEKVNIYKKINELKTDDEMNHFIYEIYNRYGELPIELKNIFQITKMKLYANSVLIESIIEKGKKIHVTFKKREYIDLTALNKKVLSNTIYIESNEYSFYFLLKDNLSSQDKINRVDKMIRDIFMIGGTI